MKSKKIAVYKVERGLYIAKGFGEECWSDKAKDAKKGLLRLLEKNKQKGGDKHG